MAMLEIPGWMCPTTVMQPFWSKYRCFERAPVIFQIHLKMMITLTGKDFKMYLRDRMFCLRLCGLKSRL